MEDHVEKFRQADALAQNILRLTRNTLLVNLRFLDLALSQFQLSSYPGTLATDGQHLFYDTYYVLSMYKRERGQNVRTTCTSCSTVCSGTCSPAPTSTVGAGTWLATSRWRAPLRTSTWRAPPATGPMPRRRR